MSDGEVDMKIDPACAKALSSQLQAVSERIGKVAAGRNVCHLIRSPPCVACEHAITEGQREERLGANMGIGAISSCFEA